jgi:anthranilate phosphoribosyltransferase
MSRTTLDKLAAGQHLSFTEAESFIDQIAADEINDSQIAAFLTGLRVKGELAEEVAGCVASLRRHALPVPHSQDLIFDCCGTGGDGSNSFNISTAAALVTAACKLPTAKHGNRAISSACGSADLLEVAGAKIDLEPQQAARLLDELGFCFLFAPRYHPVAARVAPVRKALGFRTLFNLVGPLLNPARATHQVVGAANVELARQMAAVAGHLPDLNVTTFHNSHGYDELLPVGDNLTFRWNSDSLLEGNVSIPAALGNGFQLEVVAGGSREDNLCILNDLLDGKNEPLAQVVALNAAYGLLMAERCESIDAGFELAIEALRNGATAQVLKEYVELSREAA